MSRITKFRTGPGPLGPEPGGAYLLIERLADGSCLRDTFRAPTVMEAIARVQDVVAAGHPAELWRGHDLVRTWDMSAIA